MKIIRLAIFLAASAAAAVPAAAQLGASSSYEFLNAVRARDSAKARELLSESPKGFIDARGGDNETALTIAIARRDESWTGWLLNKGADPNLQGKGGDTPLIMAARMGWDQAIQWLLAMGAKVDGVNKMGETALIGAVVQRQPQAVRRLLEAGADPDKTDTAAGYSARDYAQRDRRARDILKLIEAKKPKK